MRTPAPHLAMRDVEEELRRFHRREHRTLTTALFGTGDTGKVRVPIHDGTEVDFAVQPATCELELRDLLASHDGKPVVLLVDFDTRLPLDVRARLAGGEVRRIAHDRRLARRFGAAQVAPDLVTSELARALLADDSGGTGEDTADYSAGTTVQTIDKYTAWRRVLDRRAAIDPKLALSEEQLLELGLRPGPSPSFLAWLSREGLEAEWVELLREHAGPIAEIAWRAWRGGLGRLPGAVALLLEAVGPRLQSDGYLRARLIGVLERLDLSAGPSLREWPQARSRDLARWAELARRLKLRLAPRDFEQLAVDADQLIPDRDVASALASSNYLPRAYAVRIEALAAALAAGARERTPAAYVKARDAFAQVEEHDLAKRDDARGSMETWRMAVRLLGWLSARTATGQAPGQTIDDTPYEPLLRLACEHAGQGGFVDWARRVARAAKRDALGEAVAQVIAAVDAARDEDDARFARAIEPWLLSRRRADRVVPIDQALERLAVPFLEGGADRKLLVLLMDGMAWSNAVELILDLEEQHRFGLLRWRAKGGTLALPLPPVIAALPTTTEVSRAAFFGGKLPTVGQALATTDDPNRFADHAPLVRLNGGPPKLLLRPEALAEGGGATTKALDLVASPDRVVGIVVNAIDDQLHAGLDLPVQLKADRLPSLSHLLEAARAAGRAVLLASDHGHVSGARLQHCGGGDSARYREVDDEESVGEHEVALGGEYVWRRRARGRLALLYRETDSHLTARHYGEHGGASLAEMVAPARLIGADDLAERGLEVDPALEVISLRRPTWWNLEGGAERPLAAPSVQVAAPMAPAPAPSASRQLSIALDPPAAAPPTVIPAAAPTGTASAPTGWSSRLPAAEVFAGLAKARRDLLIREVGPRVELLVQHGGTLQADRFAALAGILPFRVAGAVAVMGELLNLDGYPVITYDSTAKVVSLHLEYLDRLFGGGA